MSSQIVYDLTSLAGKLGTSLEELQNKISVLERELTEVHIFLDTIGIPDCDENGYRDYPRTPIGKRLKHLQKRKIEFESI